MATIQIKHRYTDAVLYTHETTDERLASGLPRFQPPPLADEQPVAAMFDSDDIVDLFKHCGASAQELHDLDVMLQSVIDGAREQGREAYLRTLWREPK